MQQEAEITLIGEPVTMGSLAAGIEKKYGHSARVFCPLKGCETLLGKKDKAVFGEEAMEEALKDARIIVADPCCTVRYVQRTASFMNFRMWHFPEGYI